MLAAKGGLRKHRSSVFAQNGTTHGCDNYSVREKAPGTGRGG